MKLLSSEKIRSVSGAMSEGQIKYAGSSYPIECPFVSQSCLNSYLHYLEFDFATQKELMSALFSAMETCGGPEGLRDVTDCTKVHLNQIKK